MYCPAVSPSTRNAPPARDTTRATSAVATLVTTTCAPVTGAPSPRTAPSRMIVFCAAARPLASASSAPASQARGRPVHVCVVDIVVSPKGVNGRTAAAAQNLPPRRPLGQPPVAPAARTL